MTEYWIRAGDKVHGPLSVTQIKKLAADGKLKSGHRISTDRVKWVIASSVKGLEFSGSQRPRQKPPTTTGADAGETSSQAAAPIVNFRRKKAPTRSKSTTNDRRGSAADGTFLISTWLDYYFGTVGLIFGVISVVGVVVTPVTIDWDWSTYAATGSKGETWRWPSAAVLAWPAFVLVCFIGRVITFHPIREKYFVKHRANGKLVVVSRGYWFFKLVSEIENPWYKRLVLTESSGSYSLQLYGPTVEPITLFSGKSQRKLDKAIAKYENITGLSTQRPGTLVW